VRQFVTKAQATGTSCVSWARTHRLLATLVPVLVIVLVVGAVIVSSGGGQKGNAADGNDNSANVSGTAGGGAGSSGTGSGKGSARTTGVGHQVHAPEQPAVTKGEKWIVGPAGKLLTAVNTDVGKISAAQRAGDESAAKNLGPLLSADAKAALDGPMPPVRAAVYRVALEDFEQIGQDTTSGNFSKTSSLLTAANVDIMSVTTAANQTAPVNSAAQVNDPSDG
jgi:hypothetical protein